MILEYIVLLDYASIFIMLLLLSSIIIKKLYVLKSSKIFIVLAIMSIFTCIFDILSVSFFNEPYPLEDVYKNVGFAFNNIYYFFRTSTVIVYCLYILQLTDSLKYLLKKPIILIIGLIPIFSCFVFETINPFTNIIFDVAVKDGRFYFTTEGFVSIFLYVIPSLYFAVSIFIIIKYKYYFNKAQIVSIISIIPLSILSFVFQFISKTTDFGKDTVILVELFATTLGMVLITSTIESAPELVDTNTGLISYTRLKKILVRAFSAKSLLNIVLIDITNFYKIKNKLNYEASRDYIKDLSLALNKKSKQYKADAYSIDEGLYAIVTEELFDIKKFAEEINNEINKVYRKEFKPETKICIVTLPQDFADNDSFIKFIRNFHTRFSYNSQIISYNELNNDISFIIKNNIDVILDEAFVNHEFVVLYQPIYDLNNKSFTSCEALVRLNSKKYGFIEPSFFINYAELSGKILDIDLFVIEEAAKFISSDEFSNLGLEYINVNLAISDCLDLVLYEKVLDIIKKYNISPKCLHFELVEGNDLVDHERIHSTIKEFKKIGINFSLDNYGTGYSNISHFSKAPINTVKLDKALVDTSKNDGMDFVLANTINLIKSLGRKIVVEGIETKDNLDTFKKYNCDYIQGYYYSKPITKDELIEFINKNREVE